MHWMYRSVQRRQKGEIDWFKIAACCRFGDKCFRTAAEQREILVRDLETDLLFLQPQERLRNNTVYIWEWPKFNPAFIRTLGSWYELKAATAAKIPTLTQSTFFCFVSVEWLLSTLPPSRRKQTLINEVVKEINPLMKTVSSVSVWVFVHSDDHESRRPASQLWSSFFTLLSSLTWALVIAGAADSAASPPPTAACCSGLVRLDSISSSESSSSFSLSISSSACLLSSLRPWDPVKKKKELTWLCIFSEINNDVRIFPCAPF